MPKSGKGLTLLKSVFRRKRSPAEARLYIKAMLLHAYMVEHHVPEDMLDVVDRLSEAEGADKVSDDEGEPHETATGR